MFDLMWGGYTRLMFDNLDNIRDPEERDIFELHYRYREEMNWPSDNFAARTLEAYRLLWNISIDVLSSMCTALKLDPSILVGLLTSTSAPPSPSRPSIDPSDNFNSNFCLFRYQDDAKKYTCEQKCMVHRDSGLITLLPRSTMPGIELLDREHKHWVRIEELMSENDVLIFPGSITEIITCGLIHAQTHRVVRTPHEERYSMPFDVKPNNTSKLFIVVPPPATPCPTSAELDYQFGEPRLHPAVCDECNLYIEGTRYKCNDCPDFDFCSKCIGEKDKCHDLSHTFQAMEMPSSMCPLPPKMGEDDDSHIVAGMYLEELNSWRRQKREYRKQLIRQLNNNVSL